MSSLPRKQPLFPTRGKESRFNLRNIPRKDYRDCGMFFAYQVLDRSASCSSRAATTKAAKPVSESAIPPSQGATPTNLPVRVNTSVKLDAPYHRLPFPLRNSLEEEYAAALQARTTTSNSPTTENQVRYIVHSGHFYRTAHPSARFRPCSRCERYGSAAEANIALLHHITHQHTLSFWDVLVRRCELVQLQSYAELANPDFLYLHSVRRGDIGWGFDIHGCLSFYEVEEDESGRLQAMVEFVQRVDEDGAGAG